MNKSIICITISVLTVLSVVFWQSPLNIFAERRASKPYYPKLKMALSLLDLLQKENPNENIFYSPHSVYQGLLLTYFAAGGKTEKELENLLGVLDWNKTKADVQRAYKLEKDEQAKRFQNQSIEFISANKLYFSDRISIRKSAKKLLDDIIEKLNFYDEPNQCIEHINHFVEEITKKNIKDIVEVDENTNQTQFIIINAVYFKGLWVSQFRKGYTSSQKFYNRNAEPVNIDMMFQLESFKHGFIENLNTAVLRMPYKGENEQIAMYFFLPDNTPTAIDELLEELTEFTLDDVLNTDIYLRQKSLLVKIPKFSFETKTNLTSALQYMGVGSLFDGTANYGGFLEHVETEIKTKIMHKAKIEVDELGSIAAAATGTDPFPAKLWPMFICDHPFMFVIHDGKSQEILFAGIYRGPDQH